MNPAIFYMLKWERDAAEQGRSRAKKCGPQLHSGGGPGSDGANA